MRSIEPQLCDVETQAEDWQQCGRRTDQSKESGDQRPRPTPVTKRNQAPDQCTRKSMPGQPDWRDPATEIACRLQAEQPDRHGTYDGCLPRRKPETCGFWSFVIVHNRYKDMSGYSPAGRRISILPSRCPVTLQPAESKRDSSRNICAVLGVVTREGHRRNRRPSADLAWLRVNAGV
jgi:hypothetical protein